MQSRVEIVASGRVQGVGFRFFVRELAKKYDISGYAKNLPDGSVEIIGEGENDVLQDFLKEFSFENPFGAISVIKKDYTSPSGIFTNFEIL